MRERFPQLFFGLVLPSIGFVTGANALAGGIRDRGRDDVITVTGSARQRPEYRYAQLSKLRPELLADASRDAKSRGQRLVAAAGGKLGRLRSVSAGVFQITAPHATDTSGEGVYDTTTIDKDVTAVVRLTFRLD